MSIHNKLHIALVTSSKLINYRGGAEHVMCNMANALTNRGFTVSILCCENKSGVPAYNLNDKVQLINSYHKYPFRFLYTPFIRNIRSLHPNKKNRSINRSKIIEQGKARAFLHSIKNIPKIDLFIAYDSLAAHLLKSYLHVPEPIIVMLHSTPSFLMEKPGATEHLASMNACQGIQVLLPCFVQQAQNYFPRVPIYCIPNTITNTSRRTDLSQKKIITVARLSPDKRPELLIRSLANLKSKFPDWTCEWWGDTENFSKNYQQTKRLIQDLGLENFFFLKGTTNNIEEELCKASIFAFPSRIEGFSLALTEAFSHGLPAVGASDCLSVREMIFGKSNGLLAEPRPFEFAKALEKLMGDRDLREKLGNGAIAYSSQFSEESIWSAWEQLIIDLINESRKNKP